MFCPVMTCRNSLNLIECRADCGWYDNKNCTCAILSLVRLKEKELEQKRRVL